MKKRLMITIILILLASAGLVAAHLLTNHNGQDVKITETTLAGNFDAAKGLAVTTQIQVDHGKNCMAWETSTILNEQLKTESEMRQGEPITEEYHRFSLDVLLTSGGSYFVDGYDYTEDEYFNSLIPLEVINDLSKDIEPGETGEVTIDLSNYLETMQMDYVIDSYDPNRNYVRELSIMEGEENLFRSYFTVDMPASFPVTLKLTKNDNGKIQSIDYLAEQEVSVSSAAYVDEDYCYLAVNGYLDEEENRFYSLKDKKYSGLLRIPLHQTRQMQIKEIEKICSIDDGVFIEKLRVSPDGKNFLLLTVEENSPYLSVIDKETLELKQKINLPFSDFPNTDCIISASAGEDFYAAITLGGSYVVLSYKDGKYQHFVNGDFDDVKLQGGYIDLDFWHFSVDADIDADKVAVAVLAFGDENNITSSYCIQVRNQNKLLYCGFFDSSLTGDLAVRNIMDFDIDVDFVR